MQPTSHDAVLAAWRGLDDDVLARLPEGGDPVKQRLLHPALLRLVGEPDGVRVLEVGCGTGELSVLLAASGAEVTALEASPALARHTRRAAVRHGVEVKVVEGDLLAPRPDLDGRFEVTLASLVVCGIPDLDAALGACLATLRPGGLLVLAVEHPCFEQNLREWTRTGVAEVTRYLGRYEIAGSVAPDFHRPLSAYVTCLLQAGCRLVALDEPGVDDATVAALPFLHPLRELPLFLLLAARTPTEAGER